MIASAIFSAVMRVGKLVLAQGTCGKIEASGGTVVVPATHVPTGLVYGMVADPAGNRVGVFAPPPLT